MHKISLLVIFVMLSSFMYTFACAQTSSSHTSQSQAKSQAKKTQTKKTVNSTGNEIIQPHNNGMNESSSLVKQKLKANQSWFVDYYNEAYDETLNNKQFMSEKANMFTLGYMRRDFDDEQWYLQQNIRLSYGYSRYIGSTRNGAYGSSRYYRIPRYTLDLEMTLHYQTKTSLSLTPYAGLGYRFLSDELQRIGDAGYLRQSNYFYLITGISAKWLLFNNVIVTPYVQYDYLIRGQQDSYLFGTGASPVRKKQKKGMGFELGLPISPINSSWTVMPFMRYWHIADSEHVKVGNDIFMEPDNVTKEAGIRLMYSF